jgi:hypothetical protein
MVEGGAVASVLGMLEEREAAASVRVEGLREEVVRLAELLEAAEIELDRWVIAREELVEALAVSAAESTAVPPHDRGRGENGAALAPVPGSTAPPWRKGLPVTVRAPDYERTLGAGDHWRHTFWWQRLKALTTWAPGAATTSCCAAEEPPPVSRRKPGPAGLEKPISTLPSRAACRSRAASPPAPNGSAVNTT